MLETTSGRVATRLHSLAYGKSVEYALQRSRDQRGGRFRRQRSWSAGRRRRETDLSGFHGTSPTAAPLCDPNGPSAALARLRPLHLDLQATPEGWIGSRSMPRLSGGPVIRAECGDGTRQDFLTRGEPPDWQAHCVPEVRQPSLWEATD